MLGKKTRPMIGKLSELLVSRSRVTAILDTIGSPRSPLDMNLKMQQSPKGLKSYDLGGVGLGIVVALEISGEGRHKMNRSRPIPVSAVRNQHGFIQRGGVVNEIDVGSSEEDYTCVTYHVPNKSITKVYYDGGGEGGVLRNGYKINNNNNNICVVGRTTPPTQNLVEGEPSFPTSDFLSSCHLCRKKLHGKDIYMYRGEKGFCSPECRSRHIAMDERKEICRSEASMSVELSSSPYTRDQMFSTGIVVL